MSVKTKAQQLILEVALAVRKGKLSRSKASKAALHIVDSKISTKKIEEHISTNHKDLQEVKLKKKFKKFEDVKVGDLGEDYGGQEGIVKAKGKLKDLKSWFTRGQSSYSEVLEDGFLSPEDDAVAVLPVDDTESFDSPKGSTFVFSYDGSGFMAYEDSNFPVKYEDLEESKIKKYQNKITVDQYAEIKDKPNKAKDWEWNEDEQLYIRKVVTLPTVTLKYDPTLDIHAGDYKVLGKKEQNGGEVYELRSISNPGLVITLPATYVDSKGIKKESMNESSHSDFLSTYSHELRQASSKIRKVQPLYNNIDRNILKKIIPGKLEAYDNNVSEMIDSWASNMTPCTKESIADFAIANQDKFGTEPKQVLNAINDYYDVLCNLGIIKETVTEEKKVIGKRLGLNDNQLNLEESVKRKEVKRLVSLLEKASGKKINLKQQTKHNEKER